MKRQISGSLVLVFGLASVMAAPPASATFPGANGKIVYDTYEQDTDGCCPSVYVMNPDGSGRKRLAADGSLPVWSPNGEQIAYVDLWEGECCPDTFLPTVTVMNADGSAKTKLASGGGSYIPSLSWSVDGTTILFVKPEFGETSSTSALWTVSVDTGALTKLTDLAGYWYGAQYSPDGQTIAIARSSDSEVVSDIFLMDADGSDLRNLTNDEANDGGPSWSPTGQRLVYASEPVNEMNATDIYAVDADGSDKTRLTNESGNDASPAWSPDGTKIIYSGGGDLNYGTWVMNADGSGKTQMTGHGTAYSGLTTTAAVSLDWQACSTADSCPGGELADPVATSTSLRVTGTAESLVAAGAVSPPQTVGAVTVKLFKKRDGRFRLIKKKLDSLDSESSYRASFTRPVSGSCKIVASFGGNEEAARSGATELLEC